MNTPPPLADKKASLRELFDAAKNHPTPFNPPRKDCQSDLQRLAARHGCKNFLAAGHEFLRREGWFDIANGYCRRTDKDPWQTFADDFDGYLADHVRREDLKARRDAADRELAAKRAAEERAAALKHRWTTYLDARGADWPTMTADDRAFVASIVGEPGDVHPVSDEDYHRACDIDSRLREYRRNTKKGMLLAVLEKQQVRRERNFLVMPNDYWDALVRIKERLEAASYEDRELAEDCERQLKQAFRRVPTKREEPSNPVVAEWLRSAGFKG